MYEINTESTLSKPWHFEAFFDAIRGYIESVAENTEEGLPSCEMTATIHIYNVVVQRILAMESLAQRVGRDEVCWLAVYDMNGYVNGDDTFMVDAFFKNRDADINAGRAGDRWAGKFSGISGEELFGWNLFEDEKPYVGGTN